MHTNDSFFPRPATWSFHRCEANASQVGVLFPSPMEGLSVRYYTNVGDCKAPGAYMPHREVVCVPIDDEVIDRILAWLRENGATSMVAIVEIARQLPDGRDRIREIVGENLWRWVGGAR